MTDTRPDPFVAQKANETALRGIPASELLNMWLPIAEIAAQPLQLPRGWWEPNYSREPRQKPANDAPAPASKTWRPTHVGELFTLVMPNGWERLCRVTEIRSPNEWTSTTADLDDALGWTSETTTYNPWVAKQ
jgi:hypothetical protein